MTASLRCISCGHPIQDPPQLHKLEDGRPCVTCRDRALDALPPLLPFDRDADPYEYESEGLSTGDLYDQDDEDDGDLAG